MFLKPGDTERLSIDRLGVQEQRVIPFNPQMITDFVRSWH